MKKIFTLLLVFLTVFAMIRTFSFNVKAESVPERLTRTPFTERRI